MRQTRLLALACVVASAAAAATAFGGPLRTSGHASTYLVTLSGTQQTDVVDRTAAGGGGAECAGTTGEQRTIRFSTPTPTRAALAARAPLPTLRLRVAARIGGSDSRDAVACGPAGPWSLADDACGPVSTSGRVAVRWVGFAGRIVLSGRLADPRRRNVCASRLAAPSAALVQSEARIDPRTFARHSVATITVAGNATVTDRSDRAVETRTRVTWKLVLRRVG